jgi:hypothetical protein
MKTKHIVIGVAAVGTIALAGLNYGYEFAYGKTPKDLCSNLKDFIYADAVRDVETKFSLQDFTDMMQWQMDKSAPNENAKVTCKDVSKGDGKLLYQIDAGKISKKFVFGVKESKHNTLFSKKHVAAVVRVIDDDGKTIENGIYWMKLMDWIPAQMEDYLRIKKSVEEIDNSK